MAMSMDSPFKTEKGWYYVSTYQKHKPQHKHFQWIGPFKSEALAKQSQEQHEAVKPLMENSNGR